MKEGRVVVISNSNDTIVEINIFMVMYGNIKFKLYCLVFILVKGNVIFFKVNGRDYSLENMIELKI